MEQEWWTVRTGASQDDQCSDAVLLGTFFGYVDDIALRLADQQRGFWCAGALYFTRSKGHPELPRDEVRPDANVVIRGIDYDDHADLLARVTRVFEGRPVDVRPATVYGAVSIRRTPLPSDDFVGERRLTSGCIRHHPPTK